MGISSLVLFVLPNFIGDIILKRLCLILFNYIFASFIIFLVFVVISTTSTYRQIFVEKLKQLKMKLPRSSYVEDGQVAMNRLNELKTFDGQKMFFSTNEEKNLYFQQLANDWNSKFPNVTIKK
uniref:ATP synthase F0 subunit 8 n=1 Tax=Acrobeloides nanus TaxID=290746 RepID=A0A914DQS1_9BILA